MTDSIAKTVTARSLLRRFVELRVLTPDFDDWTEDRLLGNPPSRYRLLQLRALFRAFEIPWKPASFARGGFIDSESPRYASLYARLRSDLETIWPTKEKPPTALEERALYGRASELPRCFEILLSYRQKVQPILWFLSGVLSASGLRAYAFRKAAQMNHIIRENIPLIEDILIAFISPEAKAFSIERLVEELDYPEADLQKVDFDVELLYTELDFDLQ
jgi:hypothetical protein